MINKRLLILGANGMLGGSVHRYFSRQKEFEVLGTVRSKEHKKRISEQGFDNIISQVDATNESVLRHVLSEFKPDVVINCIGIIKQNSSSQQPIPSIEVNALLPHRLAKLCENSNARLIHFSTDCVFSGRKGMYKESDVADARDLYGRSKFLGEVNYGPHVTLRTSIIGHELNSNISLIDWFLCQSGSINGFKKAFFSGLPTIFVAKFIHSYLLNNPRIVGLYHLSADKIDKYTLLKIVKDTYSKNIEINETNDFYIDRSLNSDKLRSEIDFELPSWDSLISIMHEEYIMDFKSWKN